MTQQHLINRLTEQYADQLTDRLIERFTDLVSEQFTDRMIERYADQLSEQLTDRLIGRYADQLIERFTDLVSEQFTDRMIERYADQLTEQLTDRLVKQLIETGSTHRQTACLTERLPTSDIRAENTLLTKDNWNWARSELFQYTNPTNLNRIFLPICTL
jgi:ribosomal protein S17E